MHLLLVDSMMEVMFAIDFVTLLWILVIMIRMPEGLKLVDDMT